VRIELVLPGTRQTERLVILAPPNHCAPWSTSGESKHQTPHLLRQRGQFKRSRSSSSAGSKQVVSRTQLLKLDHQG
jgi:hypothetical protein